MLVSVMLFVTGVAVVLGYQTLKELASGCPTAEMVSAYARIVMFTGAAELFSLIVAVCIARCLSGRITRPVENLANRAIELTRRGATASLATDGPIKEINQLSIAFNTLFAAQEARIRELRDLATNVLHDLKTPLTTVQNAAELAMGGRMGSSEAGARIIEGTQTILKLIAVNSEISQSYFGYSQPFEEVNITDIVLHVVELLAPVAEGKGVELGAQLPETPVRIKAHRSKTLRLLDNLVDNAIKFTPQGGKVIVRLSFDERYIMLQVSDTGCGIPAEDIKCIYKRFYRCDSSRHSPGFGLGLSLVHAISTLYHGSVECRSEPGKGTEFTVRLPWDCSIAPDGARETKTCDELELSSWI